MVAKQLVHKFNIETFYSEDMFCAVLGLDALNSPLEVRHRLHPLIGWVGCKEEEMEEGGMEDGRR